MTKPKTNRDNRPWVIVQVVAKRNGKYLVGDHHDTGLVFPGGRLEPFESMYEAAVREFTEETGLFVELDHQIGAFEMVDRHADRHKIAVVFAGNIVGGEVRASDDISRVLELDADELRARWDLGNLTRKILDAIDE